MPSWILLLVIVLSSGEPTSYGIPYRDYGQCVDTAWMVELWFEAAAACIPAGGGEQA